VGGKVTGANYVILLPERLDSDGLATIPSSATNIVTSANGQRLAYVLPGSGTVRATLVTMALPDATPVTRFTVPVPAEGAAAETITDVQWSADGSHLLLITQSPSGAVYREMAAASGEVIDLTAQYRLDFTGLRFSPNDWRQLFWISPDGLRKLDLGEQAVSGVLASNVTQFDFAGDRLVYVQATSLGKSLMATSLRNPSPNNRAQLVAALPQSDRYQLDYGRYQNEDALAVIPTSTREATLYTGIFGTAPVSSVVAREVDNVSFSPDGRYAAFTSATQLVTYNLAASTPKLNVNYVANDLAGLSSLRWFDEYHLVLGLGGKTVFSDFDGTNRTELGNLLPGTTPIGTDNEESVYSVAPGVAAANGATLTRITIKP
jgi:hypothetical protein